MNVMYTCDNNYIWLMAISVISLFENNKHINELTVYLIGENITQANKTELAKIGKKYGRIIEIIEAPKLDIPSTLVSARWPLSAFIRLYSGTVLPKQIDKVLYLDCDTIVSGDISELDSVNFDGNIVMGVKDCISVTYKRNIGLNANSLYINAGVILFDIKSLREIDIISEINSYMNKYGKYICYADQDILNGVFNDRIGELNPKYNVMTIDVSHTYEEIIKLRRPSNFYFKTDLENAKSNPVIIHYTTNMLVIRPWYTNTNHPLKNKFVEYMSISVWRNKTLHEMLFVTKESKIIKMLMLLPDGIAYAILGLIHAEIKPRYIKMRANLL